jgi:AraC family transcriptional regulator
MSIKRTETHEVPGGVQVNAVTGTWPTFVATRHSINGPGEAPAVFGRGGITVPLRPAHGLVYDIGGKTHTVDLQPGMVLMNGTRPLTCLRWGSALDCVRIELNTAALTRLEDAGWLAGRDLHVAEDQTLLHIGTLIGSAVGEGGSEGCLFAESLGTMLMAHIDRRYGPESEGARPAGGERIAAAVLRRIRDEIEARLAEPLRLKELADSAHLSEFHFLRAFKRAVGLSPHQYITTRRMERAKALLTTTELPISEIAWQVGFSNTSHFTSYFRKHTGVTPGSFRTHWPEDNLIGA